MQLTAPLKDMTVNDVVNGNVSGGTPNPDFISKPAADSIGQAFALQFYTTLSKARNDVQKFYGHESVFNYNNTAVVGQHDISKFYEDNLPANIKIKILSINGVPTLHQGILLQVVGLINQDSFVQTFILGQQCLKKYYVECDLLQYLTNVFDSKSPQQAPVQTKAKVNGHPVSNGKPQTIETATPQKPISTPVKATPPPAAPQKTHKTPQKTEETVVAPPQKEKTPKIEKVVEAPKPAPKPVPQEPSKPMSWANLVGNGLNKSASVQYAPAPQEPVIQAAPVTKPQVAPPQENTQSNQNQNGSITERKIYLGGILRTFVPDRTEAAEIEIRQLFQQYGEVDDVHVPRKVLDFPNDTSKTAFAFITMRKPAFAQKVFDAATKDEQGLYRLPLKLDAFGFDGLATISEQKDRPGFNGGGFRGRGGFQGRGGFVPRGGPRGAGRGGPRGGSFNNHHHQQNQH